MSHQELEQLARAEELFDAGKLDEALEILNDPSQYSGLNSQQKGYYQFLKGLILIYQVKSEEVIEWGKYIVNEAQMRNDNLQLLDGLFFVINGLGNAKKFDKALKEIEKAEAVLRLCSNISENILIQKKVRISVLKAWANLWSGNPNIAEECLEWIFNSQKKNQNTFDIVWANLIMGDIMLRAKSKYNRAMEYAKNAFSIAKEIKFNHHWIGFCHVLIGVIYLSFGEFDPCLKHYMKSLTIFKQINSHWWIAVLFNNLGWLYHTKGEYDLALEYLEESLKLWEQLPERIFNLDAALNGLIEVSLEKGDTERAQQYFHRLEMLFNQKKDQSVEFSYNISKALMLKRSSRFRDKVKAEELFKHFAEKETLAFDATIDCLVHLCDLLLAEFRVNNNSEVLDEINHYIAKLLTIAEKSHSYLVFCETFILQAKLALLNFNVEAARRFLTQAQKIAESYGITRLAMKISHEHDELLKQLDLWKKLKESEAPLSERWKLAGLNEQMENMVKKRVFESPKISEEEPVSIFIITEGGTPLFSHSFRKDQSFEPHLFSGFLTTIDYFIREMFSEGLDRAIFGEYTLFMKSIPPFIISYIFKGDSYYALQKINYFVNHIQKEIAIWQILLKSFQVNQAIHLKDIPSLASLIKEIFSTKNIEIS